MRSVETSRYLAPGRDHRDLGHRRFAGTDPRRSRPDERTTLTGTVRLEAAMTAWTRWGHRLPVAADVAALAVLLFGLARGLRVRSRRTTRDPKPA